VLKTEPDQARGCEDDGIQTVLMHFPDPCSDVSTELFDLKIRAEGEELGLPPEAASSDSCVSREVL
jgi:hypothetical protein